MKTMNLKEIVDNLNHFDDNQFIGMKRPWSVDQECILVEIPPDYRFPPAIEKLGYSYFLEVFTAKEVLEPAIDREMNKENQAKALLFYAQNDAFPEWYFE